MDLSLLITMILSALFCLILVAELETRLLKISDFLNNKAWDKLFFLAKWLYDKTLGNLLKWVKSLFSNTWVSRLSDTLANKGLGGLQSLLWAVAALTFLIVWLVRDPASIEDLAMNYLTGTAIGAPVALALNGFSFAVPTLIGAGFTRFLTTEAMRQQNTSNDQTSAPEKPEMHIVAKWVYGLILVGAFSILGTAMTGIFEKISATILMLIDKISALQLFAGSVGFWDFFYLIVGIVGFIVVGYSWLLLVFMTLKEYISNVSYCLLPLLFLTFISVILSLFGLETVNLLAGVLFVLALLLGEWHRYRMENNPIARSNYLSVMNRFRLITNYVWPWLRNRLTRRLCPCSPCSIFRFFR